MLNHGIWFQCNKLRSEKQEDYKEYLGMFWFLPPDVISIIYKNMDDFCLFTSFHKTNKFFYCLHLAHQNEITLPPFIYGATYNQFSDITDHDYDRWLEADVENMEKNTRVAPSMYFQCQISHVEHARELYHVLKELRDVIFYITCRIRDDNSKKSTVEEKSVGLQEYEDHTVHEIYNFYEGFSDSFTEILKKFKALTPKKYRFFSAVFDFIKTSPNLAKIIFSNEHPDFPRVKIDMLVAQITSFLESYLLNHEDNKPATEIKYLKEFQSVYLDDIFQDSVDESVYDSSVVDKSTATFLLNLFFPRFIPKLQRKKFFSREQKGHILKFLEFIKILLPLIYFKKLPTSERTEFMGLISVDLFVIDPQIQENDNSDMLLTVEKLDDILNGMYFPSLSWFFFCFY